MTDDELDDFATALAIMAGEKTRDPAMAAAVLYQASVAVLLVHFKPTQIQSILRTIAQRAEQDALAAIGAGETRQ